MKYYLIPIGGTGARVMRAFLHLLAAGGLDLPGGAVPPVINLMGLDPDSTNGSVELLQQLYGMYEKLWRGGVFKPEVRLPAAVTNCMNLPVLDHSETDFIKTADRNKSFFDLTNMDQADPGLCSFLFERKESGMTLKDGFCGYTSIGSYLMADYVQDEDGQLRQDWRNFFQGIEEGDQIILVGSLFGGTGASGGPAIARILRDNTRDPATNNATITGIFMEPYFAPVDDGDTSGRVNSDAFPVKAKIALEYYSQEKMDKKVFDKLYIIGENAEMMRVTKHVGGKNQRNKANILELYAAAAIVDVIGLSALHDGNEMGQVYLMYRGDPKDSEGDVNKFVERTFWVCNNNEEPRRFEKNIYDQVMRFLAFSVLYTKTFYPMIKRPELRKRAIYRKKYEVLVSKDGEPTPASTELYDYCKEFILWAREFSMDVPPVEDRGFIESDLLEGKRSKYVTWLLDPNSSVYNCKPDGSIPAEVQKIIGFSTMLKSGEPSNPLEKMHDSAEIYDNICRSKGGTLGQMVEDILKHIMQMAT